MAMHEAEQQSVFYVIERMDCTSRLYVADRSCGWSSDIDLAAKWDKRSTAEMSGNGSLATFAGRRPLGNTGCPA